MHRQLPRYQCRHRALCAFFILGLAAVVLSGKADAADEPLARARALGIPFEGDPGRNNAITDVPGVEVGQSPASAEMASCTWGKGRSGRA